MSNKKEPSKESIARKEKYGDRYGHKDDKKLVTFYVPIHVLERWDAFCFEVGRKRTDVLKTAMNAWIREHTYDNKNAMQIAEIKEKINGQSETLKQLYDKLANVEKDEKVQVADGKNRGRILGLLEEKPMSSKKWFLIPLDHAFHITVQLYGPAANKTT